MLTIKHGLFDDNKQHCLSYLKFAQYKYRKKNKIIQLI